MKEDINKKINQIIKNGSTKEKINLFMEDVAFQNTENEFDKSFLNEIQKTKLSESINTTADVKYYNQLVRYNKAFLMYKPYLSIYKNTIISISQNIEKLLVEMELQEYYNQTTEEILKLINNTSSFKKVSSLIEKQNKKISYINTNINKLEEEILKINETTHTINLFFAEIKTFLKKHLPLKPYIEFTKKEEQVIIDTLKILTKKINKLSITQIIPYDSIFVLVSNQAIENIIKASK